ncbi:Exo-glucosaminidase LytG [termite gut metagenome]|uniref:Peptidoglycan hydrolase n=1 Tax=termite gut metagenome TaxID=433724 RepID=A0A5J4S4K1_9ZZZZ
MRNRYNYKTLIFFFLFILVSIPLWAQQRNRQYVEYINKYSDLAVKQMKEYRIPASITLAQGLLESGAGQSNLTRKSNNHFGIKCGKDWNGRTVLHDDDLRDECFRVYRHAEDSYEDHSLFLRKRAHYAPLFRLDITDYKGWAYGLKKAGYATSPTYATQLIGIIEKYELYKYDRKGEKGIKITWENPHQVYLSNDLVYVVARNGDTLESIGEEFAIPKKKLIKYNDLPKEYRLLTGDVVYLHEKKKKAQKTYKTHIVKNGESMHSISQTYGIRLKNLYQLNHKKAEYVLEVGTVLKLR